MTKKCLFAGMDYEALGGASDFVAFGDLEYLKENAINLSSNDWYEIADHETMQVEWKGYFSVREKRIIWTNALAA